MAWFKKKSDLISQRSRELTARIAELEARIKQLNQSAQPADSRRLRSTVYPPARRATRPGAEAPSSEPVFEPVDRKPLNDLPEAPAGARYYNEAGARKSDLFGVLERIKRQFRGPPAANPKLVTYLAAGNIQGLRPVAIRKAGGPQPLRCAVAGIPRGVIRPGLFLCRPSLILRACPVWLPRKISGFRAIPVGPALPGRASAPARQHGQTRFWRSDCTRT